MVAYPVNLHCLIFNEGEHFYLNNQNLFFYFRKKKQSVRSKMTAGSGWESPLPDLSTFHSPSSQALPGPCPMLILAMRSNAHYNTQSTFSKTGIISASWLPQAGKYTLLLQTSPQGWIYGMMERRVDRDLGLNPDVTIRESFNIS